MPTRRQILAYVCGVRLTQACIHSGLDSSIFLSTAELRASIDRLTNAFDELVRATSIEQGQYQRAKDVLDHCWKTANLIAVQSLVDNDAFGDCLAQLQVFRQILISLLGNEQATLEHLQEWLLLGSELTDGTWFDPIHPITGKRLYDGNARWIPDHEDRVNKLLKTLQMTRHKLMRKPRDGELDPNLFADMPHEFYGWFGIEAGLRRLKAQAVGADLEPKGEAEIITLNQMAMLVERSVKTLKNRKRTNPYPAAVVDDAWPYVHARQWLLYIWPEQSHRLPPSHAAAMAILRSESVQSGS
jgi:hypothetical protein